MPYHLWPATSKKDLIEAAAEIYPGADLDQHTFALNACSFGSILSPKIKDGDTLFLVPRLECAP
jgi:hypothetical protein